MDMFTTLIVMMVFGCIRMSELIMHSKFVWFVNNGFSDASDCKETACNAGDQGLIPGSGRSPGEGNGNPL